MTKRCDFKYYKTFLPRRQPSNLTKQQIDKLATLSPERQAKYLSMIADLDEDAYKALNILAQAAPKRLSALTDRGKAMTDLAQQADEVNKRLMDAVPEAERMTYQETGERLLLSLSKGQVMDQATRALATPAFYNTLHNYPLLNKQLLNALESGNDAAVVALTNRLVDSAGIIAGYIGDGNAASIAMNSRKYYKNQMKKAQDIKQLFQNGAC